MQKHARLVAGRCCSAAHGALGKVVPWARWCPGQGGALSKVLPCCSTTIADANSQTGPAVSLCSPPEARHFLMAAVMELLAGPKPGLHLLHCELCLPCPYPGLCTRSFSGQHSPLVTAAMENLEQDTGAFHW